MISKMSFSTVTKDLENEFLLVVAAFGSRHKTDCVGLLNTGNTLLATHSCQHCQFCHTFTVNTANTANTANTMSIVNTVDILPTLPILPTL